MHPPPAFTHTDTHLQLWVVVVAQLQGKEDVVLHG